MYPMVPKALSLELFRENELAYLPAERIIRFVWIVIRWIRLEGVQISQLTLSRPIELLSNMLYTVKYMGLRR